MNLFDDDQFAHMMFVLVAVLFGILVIVGIARATDAINKKADCILVNACQEIE